MKQFSKISISILVLIVGLYLGTFLFVSKTEQMISWIYLIAIIGAILKPKSYYIFYILAAISITLATFLFLIGPTMVRYSHYIDKLSLWSYYFFGTAVVLSCIDIFLQRNYKK